MHTKREDFLPRSTLPGGVPDTSQVEVSPEDDTCSVASCRMEDPLMPNGTTHPPRSRSDYGKPKNALAATWRKLRIQAANGAVRNTMPRLTRTPALMDLGAATFTTSPTGSRIYMYQMTRA